MHIDDKTRPASAYTKLDQAINLAKVGRKTESCKILRNVVAAQPVNQVAWLWLSVVAVEQAEAEAALAQAKKINPAHPSLLRTEQWLVHRFSTAAPTKKGQVAKISPVSTPIPKTFRNLFSIFNSLTFGVAVLTVLAGLLILFLGLIFEVNAAAQLDAALQSVRQNNPVITPEKVDAGSDYRLELDAVWVEQDWARAIALRPDLSAPRRLIAEIEFAIAPQTSLVTPEIAVPVEDRIIVVGIAKQRMVVYEGDKQIFDFVVSTGEPGRETAIGQFEVLNKIDVAYASAWNLDMPNWMGIYWAGSLQNGIHALPIVKHTGYKLWAGYLGQRVSYGCVILSDEDAVTLYDWAEVGVRVKIVSNLADWSFGD